MPRQQGRVRIVRVSFRPDESLQDTLLRGASGQSAVDERYAGMSADSSRLIHQSAQQIPFRDPQAVVKLCEGDLIVDEHFELQVDAIDFAQQLVLVNLPPSPAACVARPSPRCSVR